MSKIFVGVFGLFGLALMALSICWNPTPTDDDLLLAARQRLQMELIERAQAAARGQLQAPGTAEFPNPWVDMAQYQIHARKDGAYQVCAWVDAQNGFGAVLRSRWAVVLKETGGRWETISVAIE